MASGKNWAKTKKYRDLKNHLEADLLDRGLSGQIYMDKAQEYLDLWCQRQQLLDDIRERGVSVMDPKRGMYVENRSVSMEIQVSRQMLLIFSALGYRDTALCAGTGNEDDKDDL